MMVWFWLISAFSYLLAFAVPWTCLSPFLGLAKSSSSSSDHIVLISSEKSSLIALHDGVPPLFFHSLLHSPLMLHYDFPDSFGSSLNCKTVALVVKNPPANAGDLRDSGSIPGSGRFPGGGNGTPLQYSCRENPMDSGTWWAIVCGGPDSRTWLGNWTQTAKSWKMGSDPASALHPQYPTWSVMFDRNTMSGVEWVRAEPLSPAGQSECQEKMGGNELW